MEKGPEGKVWNELDAVSLSKDLLLFSNRACPFGHRAWWAAEESGLKYQCKKTIYILCIINCI